MNTPIRGSAHRVFGDPNTNEYCPKHRWTGLEGDRCPHCHAGCTVDGYDARHWRDSYQILRDAITDNPELAAFIEDGETSEEDILASALERVAEALRASHPGGATDG